MQRAQTMDTVTCPAGGRRGGAAVSGTTVADDGVEVEEVSPEQGRQMLEEAAQATFGMTWSDFYAAYRSGAFVDTERARAAEQLAFLVPFAG